MPEVCVVWPISPAGAMRCSRRWNGSMSAGTSTPLGRADELGSSELPAGTWMADIRLPRAVRRGLDVSRCGRRTAESSCSSAAADRAGDPRRQPLPRPDGQRQRRAAAGRSSRGTRPSGRLPERRHQGDAEAGADRGLHAGQLGGLGADRPAGDAVLGDSVSSARVRSAHGSSKATSGQRLAGGGRASVGAAYQVSSSSPTGVARGSSAGPSSRARSIRPAARPSRSCGAAVDAEPHPVVGQRSARARRPGRAAAGRRRARSSR